MLEMGIGRIYVDSAKRLKGLKRARSASHDGEEGG